MSRRNARVAVFRWFQRNYALRSGFRFRSGVAPPTRFTVWISSFLLVWLLFVCKIGDSWLVGALTVLGLLGGPIAASGERPEFPQWQYFCSLDG